MRAATVRERLLISLPAFSALSLRSLRLCVGMALALPLAAQSNEQLLPPGTDRQKLQQLCVGCHEMDLVVARRHTRAEWEGVMEDMIARGTKGTEAEIAALVTYLTTNLGKVNVNAATAKELQAALKIDESDARAIVDWREKNGKFKNFEDVRKTPGLDTAKLADKRGWVSFE